MTPEIIPLPAFRLAGLPARFIGALSPAANNFQIIPPLWAEFFRRQAEWPTPQDGSCYGACRGLSAAERTRDDELLYLAAVAVAPEATLPAGFVHWDVPAGSYARFLHRGPIQRLPETMHHACRVWLPGSGYQTTDAALVLERYDERFLDGQSADSVLEVLIALAPAASDAPVASAPAAATAGSRKTD